MYVMKLEHERRDERQLLPSIRRPPADRTISMHRRPLVTCVLPTFVPPNPKIPGATAKGGFVLRMTEAIVFLDRRNNTGRISA